MLYFLIKFQGVEELLAKEVETFSVVNGLEGI